MKSSVNFQAGKAVIAQLGERQTEDLKVPGSIPGHGNSFLFWFCRPTSQVTCGYYDFDFLVISTDGRVV